MKTPSLTVDEVRQVWEVEPERGFDGDPIGAIGTTERPLLIVGPGVRQQQADRLAQLMARRFRKSELETLSTALQLQSSLTPLKSQ